MLKRIGLFFMMTLIFVLIGETVEGFYTEWGWPLPYEKDASKSDTGIQTVTLPPTWYIKGNNKVIFNYLIRDTEQNYGSKPRSLVALQVQMLF